MSDTPRLRFWIESAAATVSATLLVLTLVWRTWIETAFGVDPDAGSGSLEYAIVGASLVLTVGLTLLARREWVRRAIA
jgi:hypothetical protein